MRSWNSKTGTRICRFPQHLTDNPVSDGDARIISDAAQLTTLFEGTLFLVGFLVRHWSWSYHHPLVDLVFLRLWRREPYSRSRQRRLFLDASCAQDHPVFIIELLRFTLVRIDRLTGAFRRGRIRVLTVPSPPSKFWRMLLESTFSS